ncbi:MAG: inner membrane protein [Bacteroidetes bacterium]|nr:MAG: inner membrane protein [Bacteroidota bacterium]
MFLNILLLVGGLVILIYGADWLVAGASAIAKKMKVSDLAIGLTVVSFGTSAPEFVVNTFAAWQGNADIVFGNIIGSNNFNLLFILGITGLISPLVVQKSTVWKEIPISFIAVIVLYFLVNDQLIMNNENMLSRIDGIILLVFFLGFLYYVYKQLGAEEATIVSEKQRPTIVLWGMIIGGLFGLVLGGRLVVTNAVEMAQMMGVSEKIIGLTIIAAGTSLPELATSVVAALKKNNDIAVGNVVGSNIFNIFFILGASSVLKPVTFSTAFNLDLYLLAGGTLFLFAAMFLSGKKKLDRWEAALLLAVYLGYTTWLVMKELN